jgi:hypothetical protein
MVISSDNIPAKVAGGITFVYTDGTYESKYSFKKEVSMLVIGSGKEINAHVLLPENFKTVKSVSLNNKPLKFRMSKIEGSDYVDFNLSLTQIQDIVIKY